MTTNARITGERRRPGNVNLLFFWWFVSPSPRYSPSFLLCFLVVLLPFCVCSFSLLGIFLLLCFPIVVLLLLILPLCFLLFLFFLSVMLLFSCSPMLPRRSIPRKHKFPLKTSISPYFAEIPKTILPRKCYLSENDICRNMIFAPKKTSAGK